MGKFNDYGRGRGGYGGGRDDRRGGGYGGEKQMFDATCANCGGHASVPFRPTGEKPVYCRDCFKGNDTRGRDDRRGGGGFSPRRDDRRGPAPRPVPPQEDYRKQFQILNEKIDLILDALYYEGDEGDESEEIDLAPAAEEKPEKDSKKKAAKADKKAEKKAAKESEDKVEKKAAAKKAPAKKAAAKKTAKKAAKKAAKK